MSFYKLKDLILDTNLDTVISRLLTIYPEAFEEGHREAFKELIEIASATPVLAYTGNIVITRIDDEDIWYDVYMISNDKDDIRYSIDFMDWQEAVTLSIDQGVLDSFTTTDIMAHILHELTFTGFSRNEVITNKENMLGKGFV